LIHDLKKHPKSCSWMFLDFLFSCKTVAGHLLQTRPWNLSAVLGTAGETASRRRKHVDFGSLERPGLEVGYMQFWNLVPFLFILSQTFQTKSSAEISRITTVWWFSMNGYVDG
jgi:hypothetical protein